jgi:hypothetical protein
MSGNPTDNKSAVIPPPPGPAPVKRSPASKKHLRDLIDSLFNCEVEQLVAIAIERAKAGDSGLLLYCIDRAAPRRRGRAFEIEDFRPIKTVNDALAELARLVELVAAGELTVDEAGAVAGLLREYIGAVDTVELAKRLEVVEASIAEARNRGHREEW